MCLLLRRWVPTNALWACALTALAVAAPAAHGIGPGTSNRLQDVVQHVYRGSPQTSVICGVACADLWQAEQTEANDDLHRELRNLREAAGVNPTMCAIGGRANAWSATTRLRLGEGWRTIAGRLGFGSGSNVRVLRFKIPPLVPGVGPQGLSCWHAGRVLVAENTSINPNNGLQNDYGPLIIPGGTTFGWQWDVLGETRPRFNEFYESANPGCDRKPWSMPPAPAGFSTINDHGVCTSHPYGYAAVHHAAHFTPTDDIPAAGPVRDLTTDPVSTFGVQPPPDPGVVTVSDRVLDELGSPKYPGLNAWYEDQLASASDYDQILAKHAPVLLYDSDEEFHILSPSALTDFYRGTTVEESNSLKDAGGVFAVSGSTISGLAPDYFGHLGLDYLSSSYPEAAPSALGRRAGTAADSDDFISATGDADDEQYDDDARAMGVQPGYPDVVFGRVVPAGFGRYWLQYWTFYYNNPRVLGATNPFGGEHEGDWEMVQVGLGSDLEPDRAVYAQHGDAQECDWLSVERSGHKPVVYVARDSHAAYFGSARIRLEFPWDRADGLGGGVFVPEIVQLSDENPGWIAWPGRWGDSDASPPGPMFQPGEKWSDPDEWASAAAGC